jgi:hypothetical protein
MGIRIQGATQAAITMGMLAELIVTPGYPLTTRWIFLVWPNRIIDGEYLRKLTIENCLNRGVHPSQASAKRGP